MALARHRDYRTTRQYVQVDGEHLRQAVEHLVSTSDGEELCAQRNTSKRLANAVQ